MLQPIKDQVPNVSWADLMQMASALAVEDAGGPKIDMRYGREDCPTEDLKAADGVLPGEGLGFREAAEEGSMTFHARIPQALQRIDSRARMLLAA